MSLDICYNCQAGYDGHCTYSGCKCPKKECVFARNETRRFEQEDSSEVVKFSRALTGLPRRKR